ncbi:hypothetical protein BH11ACT4_BH11ACT4_25300 [soil metagenome]
MTRALPALLGAVALAALLGGCSQVAALAPVGGDDVSEVRFAAIDVLLHKNIGITDAPTCTSSGTVITCSGTTADGKSIEVTSTTAADAPLEIIVDGDTVFTGSVKAVLDAAART